MDIQSKAKKRSSVVKKGIEKDTNLNRILVERFRANVDRSLWRSVSLCEHVCKGLFCLILFSFLL